MVGPSSPDRSDSDVRSRPSLWQWLIEPAEAIQDPGARRTARLLSSLLLGLMPFLALGALSSSAPLELLMWIVFAILAMVYGVSRTRYYLLSAVLTMTLLSVMPFVATFLRGDYAVNVPGAFVWAIFTLLIGSMLFSVTGIAILAAVHILGLLLFLAFLPEITFSTLAMPLGLLLGSSALMMIASRHRDLLERDRQAELFESNRKMEAIRALLEQRVTDRTEDLERRARYLEATAAVSHEAASMLGDPRALLSRVVNLISEQFGFYHTGLFLVDVAGEWAELQAASSVGGQRMLARDHRLKVGEQGIVGYVAGRGEARIALDVGADAAFFDNPDLPDTRSEMALPLRARGQIIGVLDVQSREQGAFSDEDVGVLQSLADQVAMAIDNARLFQRAEESAQAERRARGELTSRAWRELLLSEPDLGYLGNRQGVAPAGDLWRPEMEIALHSGEAVADDGDETRLAVPIQIGGYVIGVLYGRKRQEAGRWTAEEIALLGTLTEQLTAALERARLYRETQRSAARERTIAEVGARMRSSLDLEAMLRTAASEVRQALDLGDLVIRLATLETDVGSA